MNRFVLVLVVLLLCPLSPVPSAPANAQVIRPRGGFRDQVQVLEFASPDPQIRSALDVLPPDDSGRWDCTLFLGSDDASRRLENAIVSDPSLRAVAQWANVNTYRWSEPAQRERFQAYGILDDAGRPSLPTLVINPPYGSQTWPYAIAARQSGFGSEPGAGRALAQFIIASVKGFCLRQNRAACPGPWCPVRPNVVEPDIEPNVLPFELPDLLPKLPTIPPVDVVPGDTAGSGAFPAYPQIAVVVDPQGIGEELTAKGLELLAAEVARKFPEAAGAKVVMIRLGTPEAKPYDLLPDETPAVFVTNEGRKKGFLTRGLVNMMRSHLNLPVPTQQPTETDRLASTVQELAQATQQAIAGQQPAAAGEQSSGWSLGAIGAAVGGSSLLTGLAIGLVVLVVWRTRKGTAAAAGTAIGAVGSGLGSVLEHAGAVVVDAKHALAKFDQLVTQPIAPSADPPAPAGKPEEPAK